MTPNQSTAVMQRRAAAIPGELDYFPTPPWATRALCEWLLAAGHPLARQQCWEPCCGEMHMARPLAEYFPDVRATDVHQYGANGLCDFLDPPAVAASVAEWDRPDWIITNPPFAVAEQVIAAARRVARAGVAMLVRSAFTESVGRYHALFGVDDLPSWELGFAERVLMLKGRMIQIGAPDPFNCDPATGEPRKASNATAYCWLLWQPGEHDWRKRILAPCRTQLERPGDYPAYLDQWAEAGRRQQALQQQGALL